MKAKLKPTRTCKGKKITAKEARQDRHEKVQTLKARLPETLEDARPGINTKITEHMAAIKELDSKHDDIVIGRVQCGYDLNPIIEATPFDGEVYKHTCPACGNKFTMRNVPDDVVVSDGA